MQLQTLVQINFQTSQLMKRVVLIILASVLFYSSRGQVPPINKTKAIICLTYDDGLETQLTTAIPQLDSVGIKATFFLNSVQGSSQSVTIGQTPEAVLGWTNAARHGHELGNHTLFHACPEKLGWDKTVSIENYSVDRMILEIRTQNTILAMLDPAGKQRSFAFPCNNFLIGDTDYIPTIKKLQLISYARAGGDSSSIITNLKTLNFLKVPSWHVWTGTSVGELIAFAEKVKKAGGMGVYQFHGVGGNIFQISRETHRAFLMYLKTNQEDYWVATFSEAMDFVIKQKAK